MAYAFVIEGLDPEKREEIDGILLSEDGRPDEKAKARRERAAVANVAALVAKQRGR